MTPAGMSGQEYAQAAEWGRRMAANQIATDPEARARVERAFGKDYCMNRYPEAYVAKGTFWGIFSRKGHGG
jgi:hypothetical protein